jgi:hypothetical protein
MNIRLQNVSKRITESEFGPVTTISKRPSTKRRAAVFSVKHVRRKPPKVDSCTLPHVPHSETTIGKRPTHRGLVVLPAGRFVSLPTVHLGKPFPCSEKNEVFLLQWPHKANTYVINTNRKGFEMILESLQGTLADADAEKAGLIESLMAALHEAARG